MFPTCFSCIYIDTIVITLSIFKKFRRKTLLISRKNKSSLSCYMLANLLNCTFTCSDLGNCKNINGKLFSSKKSFFIFKLKLPFKSVINLVYNMKQLSLLFTDYKSNRSEGCSCNQVK